MAKQAAKPLSPDQVLDKMAKYCAYQERCVKDVTDKLKTFDLSDQDRETILNYLIDNRFVNNERFANAFVRGKINQSGWGVNWDYQHTEENNMADAYEYVAGVLHGPEAEARGCRKLWDFSRWQPDRIPYLISAIN